MKKGIFIQFLNEMQKYRLKGLEGLEEIASNLEILSSEDEIHLPFLCNIINQLYHLTTQHECINKFKEYLGIGISKKMHKTYNSIRINENNFLLINLLLAQYPHQKYHKSEPSHPLQYSSKYRRYWLVIGATQYLVSLPHSIERIAIENTNYLLITDTLSDKQKKELTGAHKSYKYAEIVRADSGIMQYPTFQCYVKKKPLEGCPIDFFARSVKLDRKFYRQYSTPLLTNYRNKYFSLNKRIQGNNLHSYLQAHVLTITKALSIIMTIAEKYKDDFSNRSYLHRDIKPENILINEKNGIEINFVDFDFIIKCQPNEIIDCDYICGTTGYIAPEIFSNEAHPYSQKSDIFSLGVVLCSVLEGISVNYYEGMHKVCCPSTQVLLRHLLARMLNNDPTVRPHIEEVITVVKEQIHFNTHHVDRLPLLKEVVKYQAYLEKQLSPYDRKKLETKNENDVMDIYLVNKIIIVRELRRKLIWDSTLTEFENYLHENREKLAMHRDPRTQRFIANLAYFMVGGLIVSLLVNNTYAFWQARGEMVANRVENLLQQPQLVMG